jgi:hypothetical protein
MYIMEGSAGFCVGNRSSTPAPPAPAPAPALHVFPPLAPEWDAALDPDLWDKARAVLADDPPITLTHDAIY